MVLDNADAHTVAMALAYAHGFLQRVPGHWVRPGAIFAMERLLVELLADEKQRDLIRKTTGKHLAAMLGRQADGV